MTGDEIKREISRRVDGRLDDIFEPAEGDDPVALMLAELVANAFFCNTTGTGDAWQVQELVKAKVVDLIDPYTVVQALGYPAALGYPDPDAV